MRLLVTGAGVEAPVCTLHDLKTIYSFADFLALVKMVSEHCTEVKEEYRRLEAEYK